jgi:DNA replication protein DnaC
MGDFIEKRKFLNKRTYFENYIPNVNENDVNDMQTFFYKFAKYFMKTNEQFLIIINGEGRTGKTFLIYALSKLIGNKLKRCAPTSKAAFFIKVQTVHSLFRIHCSRKADYYQPFLD